ncbi:MAG: hypothetical protein K2I12_00225, partial [Duncaniella sp.]|nr:hypothetical protein [Duncaniella sp.]
WDSAEKTACRCYCKILYVTLWTFNLLYVTKLQKLSDMTKPRLAKVRALFYVLQQLTKEAAPILTQPLLSLPRRERTQSSE